jgi:hypothetical protein
MSQLGSTAPRSDATPPNVILADTTAEIERATVDPEPPSTEDGERPERDGKAAEGVG